MSNLTVAIPARDESLSIGDTLASLASQRGVPLDSFDVIVLANNCIDDTADRVRTFATAHPELTVNVVETTCRRAEASVGRARRTVMNLAAIAFDRRSMDGIIATTDADTIVDSNWIANTLEAIRDIDAVAGRIDIRSDDLLALPTSIREIHQRNRAYVDTVALLEATLDPTSWDPAPRHGDHFGASFAVRCSAYTAVGGVPDLKRLEDLALYHALVRHDRRVRHAANVRVETSARRDARVSGGFASYVDELFDRRDWRVENPKTTLANIRARAALRRYFVAPQRSELGVVAEALELPFVTLQERIDVDRPFGENWQSIEALAEPLRRPYADVPPEEATITLLASMVALAKT